MSRSSQASISINSFTELSKTQFSLWVSLSHLIKAAAVNKSQGQKMTENILHLFNKKRREEQRGRKLI